MPAVWWCLIVTMDDATCEHTSMFFVEQEGTASSLHRIGQAIAAKGRFCSLYTDRGSHYFHPPGAGSKVDQKQLTQVGRALSQSGDRAHRGRDERPNRLPAAGFAHSLPLLQPLIAKNGQFICYRTGPVPLLLTNLCSTPFQQAESMLM